MDVLRHIEDYRQGLARQTAQLQHWFDGSPELEAFWTEFTRAGGVTAADLIEFFEGRFRPRRCRRNRHLRLIVSKPFRIRPHDGDHDYRQRVKPTIKYLVGTLRY